VGYLLLLIAVVANFAAAAWSVYRTRQWTREVERAREDLRQLKDDVLNAASLVVLLADERVPAPSWVRRLAQEAVTPALRECVQVNVSVSSSDEAPTRRIVH